MPAKFLQLGDLHRLKSQSRLCLAQAGAGTAGACSMLTKKWSVRVLFISLLVHLILIPFHGKSE